MRVRCVVKLGNQVANADAETIADDRRVRHHLAARVTNAAHKSRHPVRAAGNIRGKQVAQQNRRIIEELERAASPSIHCFKLETL